MSASEIYMHRKVSKAITHTMPTGLIEKHQIALGIIINMYHFEYLNINREILVFLITQSLKIDQFYWAEIFR